MSPTSTALIDFFVSWAGWVLALLAIVFAVKATVRFDVNEWLKERRKQNEEHLRSLCPHVQVFEERGEYGVRTTYIPTSSIGATAWQCEKCKKVTRDPVTAEEVTAYWAENPKALQDRHEKMKKLAKKLGRG